MSLCHILSFVLCSEWLRCIAFRIMIISVTFNWCWNASKQSAITLLHSGCWYQVESCSEMQKVFSYIETKTPLIDFCIDTVDKVIDFTHSTSQFC